MHNWFPVLIITEIEVQVVLPNSVILQSLEGLLPVYVPKYNYIQKYLIPVGVDTS